jgi:HAD superfamily hydrolase (TIGR01490 family)
MRAMTAPAGIAFFDLDRTLLSVNSATLWVKRELRLGYISKWSALRGAMWLGLYELGFGRMDDAVRSAIASLEGQAEDEIRARTTAFWHEEVADQIRPGAYAALEAHRSQGEPPVLLTSSSNYLSQLAADALSIDQVCCNRFQVQDGMFTGEPVEPLCFGAGKLVHATSTAQRMGLALSECAFYTDSHSDLPVMEAVGRPVAVHPDPRLRREAQRRGWPIVDWTGSDAPLER